MVRRQKPPAICNRRPPSRRLFAMLHEVGAFTSEGLFLSQRSSRPSWQGERACAKALFDRRFSPSLRPAPAEDIACSEIFLSAPQQVASPLHGEMRNCGLLLLFCR